MRITGRVVSIAATLTLFLGLGAWAGAAGSEGRIDLSSLEPLRAKASEVTEANLDAPAIRRVVENPKLAGSIKDVARGLTEVHALSIELGDKGTIKLSDLDAIRDQLKGSAWTRVLSNQEKAELQELYTLTRGEKVVGIVVLAAESRELAVVNLVGSVDPAQLSALDFDGLGELGEALVEGQTGDAKKDATRPATGKNQTK
jgi:hypothetical protein